MKFKLPLIAAFVAVLSLTACGGGSSGSAAAPTVAAVGTTATVKYTGWLYSATATNNKGTQFDSGQFAFKLGTNAVIPGFEAAVTGMKVADKKTVTIPSAQAYGANPPAGIPANADLVFDIELVALN